MAENELEQILSNNGFSYRKYHQVDVITLIIENIEISEIYEQITFIDVCQYGDNTFSIFINLKDDYIINKSDFNINLSAYNYDQNSYGKYLRHNFNRDAFIEELHRLNFIGRNIKNAKKMIL